MKLEINDIFYDKFCSVCKTLEKNPSEQIEELIHNFVKKYSNDKGCFTPKKAILFDSALKGSERNERGPPRKATFPLMVLPHARPLMV